MRQAATLQAQMAEAHKRAAETTFAATAGGGLVTAVVRGSGEVVEIRLDPSVLDPSDPELVGDLVVAAVNQALEKAKQSLAGDVESATGDLDLHGLGLGDIGV